MTAVSSLGRGISRGRQRANEVLVTRPRECTNKKGTDGTLISIVSNYFKLKMQDWRLVQYR